ncbi:MAG: aminomethyl-transferring glycine dehydrogenase subunit GcvPA [Rhodospirillales bacterium]|nr:aminomethyl-transferring glycine dehydrogenase subunit GcvPA [Rhodospirillales bacterium]
MRYLPLTEAERAAMRAAIGVASIDDLFIDVPQAARLDRPLPLPGHRSELEVERILSALAAKNLPAGRAACFLGGGFYRHHIPAALDQLLLRGEFLTSYTPYQPEVSQGTLQALFEFQSQVALITGMEVANASLYDGATATAEAVLMAGRITKRPKIVLSGGLHPHFAKVAATQARYVGLAIEARAPDPTGGENLLGAIDAKTACVVVQNPSVFGAISDLRPLAKACQAAGALLVVVVTEPLALGLIESPGAMGADIVVAEGTSLGVGLNFGGPGLGLFATREKYVRQMPGRLVGETVDVEGQRGWVLTLSTREQHIRREKATSNICTNSGLCALAFSMHLTFLGEAGFVGLAELNHARAVATAERLAAIPGVTVLTDGFFNEFAIRLAKPAHQVVERLAAKGILAGVPGSRLWPAHPELADLLLVAATETVEPADIDALANGLAEALR